jgi:predicted enzyme related to lactoylglutathione lyase
MSRTSYIELPARDIATSTSFYEQVFGWSLTPFGPTYASTLTGDVDIGLQADLAEMTKAPLPVISVTDLEATLAAVQAAGAQIVKPIFAFPGGRRFQFLDPHGNELAAMQPDDQA